MKIVELSLLLIVLALVILCLQNIHVEAGPLGLFTGLFFFGVITSSPPATSDNFTREL